MPVRIKYFVLFFLLSSTMFSKGLREGVYRGVLLLDKEKNIELPFNFDVTRKGKKTIITIKNAEEKIVVDEITVKGDSVNFKMPFYNTEFLTKMAGDTLQGVWINHYRTSKNIIPFKATFNQTQRFLFVPDKANPEFEGKWEVTFSPGSQDSSKAIGIFHHLEQTDYVTGTFLSETGDYRYLEGMKHGNDLYLSCFDGSHAFLFSAQIRANKIVNGKFYSGSHWEETWEGRRNEAFRLREADEIVFLKNKSDKLTFSYPNPLGKKISLDDEKFENKAVIVQIMGTWCPNCMDETLYLNEIYRTYKSQGLEIVALAFEKTDDFNKAKSQVLKLKSRLKVDYDILITLLSGKEKASEAFPMLNGIPAFPTTLFLDRSHQVVKVFTGFSGPATGKEFDFLKQRTENQIQKILQQ